MKAVAPLQMTRFQPVASATANLAIQRKCACGGSAGLSGECEDCRKKRLGVQAKLTIDASSDPLEREADRVADQVMSDPPKGAVGGSPLRIQRFSPSSQGPSEAPASVARALSGAGRPLEPQLRRDMEQRFGHDFSKVRVHTDAAAARSATGIAAQAYTSGTHIVFGAGHYLPETPSGRHLLAHELTHVVQQSASGTGTRPQPVMRKGFESTVQVCHRVLESRKFSVDNGGVRVVLVADSPDLSAPNCRDFEFGVTLTRSEDWWPDKEIGTCEATTGGIRTFSFANVPAGTYYLTFWRLFDHPYCCLEGDVLVYDEKVASDGEGCRRAKDLSAMDIVHGALDIAGFIPVLGAIPDGINAAIYVAEGDWANAGLSAVAMVPAWGDGVKLATMGGKTVVRVTGKAAAKLGPEGIAKGLKEVKEVSTAAKVAESSANAAKAETKLAEEALGSKAAKSGSEAKKAAADPSKAPTKSEPATQPKDDVAAGGKEKSSGDKSAKKAKPRCTPAEIEAMNLALHVYCNQPRSCSMQGDTCATATAKVSAGIGCVEGRTVLQQRCFRKGDPGYQNHMQQIAQASAALRNCQAVMMAKCT